MRINVYTEELTQEAEIVTADYISSRTGQPMTNYGLRIYLKSHPDLHYIPGRDDDRSAVTFWCGSDKEKIYAFITCLRTATVDRLHAGGSELEERVAELYRAQKNRILSVKSTEHDIGTLQETIARLRGALKPFANIALEHDCNHGGDDCISGPDLAITPRNVRDARDALSEPSR